MKIMFICSGNSCRSQMAEGFARKLSGGSVTALSAGLRPEDEVNPLAVMVMNEVGIDISGQKPKAIDPNLLAQMDFMVTLCGEGDESCPATPPSVKRIHMPVNDPSKARGSGEEVLAAFRSARNEIEEEVASLISSVLEEQDPE